METEQIATLRQVITENIRVQVSGEPIDYINVGTALGDAQAKQNHAIFARRGCGKTLLLHTSGRNLQVGVVAVYLNCEDFKRHSFPNVLIEILTSIFAQFEQNSMRWFGRGKKTKILLENINNRLTELRQRADKISEQVTQKAATESSNAKSVSGKVAAPETSLTGALESSKQNSSSIERTFEVYREKLQELDLWLPELKRNLDRFLSESKKTKCIFLQIDDLYHLRRTDQAFVIDYIHRLCKDIPMFFKVATLRHVSTLYVDRDGQPTGAQERHDYQPINIDYTFSNFEKTRKQNWSILIEFAKRANISEALLHDQFKGDGFSRLVMAGGGVPRDVLSLFIEILGDGAETKIGKDEVRILSKANFERRIDELKQDSQDDEQDALLKGIYSIRAFCLRRKTNVFLLSERNLQQNDNVKALIFRLMDYRIIHSCADALTHKSQEGSYQAFAIDIGCYAHMRKLTGKLIEIDLTKTTAKEKMRSAPILEFTELIALFDSAPNNIEAELLKDENVG